MIKGFFAMLNLLLMTLGSGSSPDPNIYYRTCDFYSRKAIHNHISKLRKKLRFEPDLPNYIESVAGIGYKFEHL